MVNERRKQEEAVKQDHHTIVGLESMLASLLSTTVDVVLFLLNRHGARQKTIPTVASSTSCVS